MSDAVLGRLRFGVLGAGAMGSALVRALVKQGAPSPDRVLVSDPHRERREALAQDLGVRTTDSGRAAAEFADLLLLAVKPQVFDKVLADIAPATGPDTLVVSIAAGVSIATMQSQLAAGTRVVRCMPNTPALVGAAATGIASGEHASEEDRRLVRALFERIGIAVEVDETLLDAVTGLSGSGPAFIFVIIEALADAGVKMGLSRSASMRLAAQTVYGAAKLLIETGEHPGRLKDMVCSPGGTTIAGLHTLESGGLRTTLMDAVEQATLRSRELGRELEGKLGS